VVKVVFCLYGDKLLKEAKMMVATCKRLGYHLVQMSDENTVAIEGVDEVVRKPMNRPQVTFRYWHLCDIEPPYISLDVDLLVLRDISDMLDMNFDVTMTKREAAEGMVYNGGVFSVQKRGFIEECLKLIENMPPEWQNWTGGQRAMATLGASGKYRVKELPYKEWNYSPNSAGDKPKTSRVLHFKGSRKGFMPDAFMELKWK